MKNNYIGITGFTDKKQIIDSLDYIKEIDSKQTYMFGFLVSERSLRFETLKNKRYLNFSSFNELKELMSYSSNKENILNMIHFNTREKEFSNQLIPLLKELGDVVEAVQFNLGFIDLEQYKILRKEFPNLKLLLQYNNVFEEKYSPYEIYCTLKEIGFEYLLIDFSGGKGHSFEPEYLKRAYEKFNVELFNTNLGVAGGLSGDNVKDFMSKLDIYNIPYFIDAESKLRDKLSDKYGDDAWNQDKVNKYILNSINKKVL